MPVGPEDRDNEPFQNQRAQFEITPQFIMIDPERSLSGGLSSPRTLSWEILRACIEVAGGEVKSLPPAKTEENETSGETYVQDPFAVIPELKIALGSLASAFNTASTSLITRNFEHEQAYLGPKLAQDGYKIITVPQRIEGGNILYHAPSKTLFQGYFPDNPEGLGTEESRQSLELALRRVDPEISVMTVPIARSRDLRHVFHLDQCMSILPQGEILIDKTLVSSDTLEKIDKKVGQENVFPNNKVEDGHNLVSVGMTLITEEMDFRMRGFLKNRGYTIITRDGLGRNEGDIFSLVWDKLEKNRAVENFLKDPYPLFIENTGSASDAIVPRDAAALKEELFFALKQYGSERRVHLGGINDGGPHCISVQIKKGKPATEIQEPKNNFDRNRIRY